LEDMLLVVEYNQKGDKVTFFTKNYMLIDNNNIMIEYKKFSSKPNIEDSP